MHSILLFTLQIKRNCTLIQPILICKLFGGGKRDRTDDPLLAKQVLYQLSYAPYQVLVGLVGLEPTTPRLSSVCSNHLSYKPFVLHLRLPISVST